MIKIALARQRHGARRARPAWWLASSLASIALVVSGCQDPGANSAHPDANASQPIQDAGGGQLGVEAVYTFLAATGSQLAQGVAFDANKARLENIVIARCMATRGFSAADQPYIRYDEQYFNPLQGSPIAPGFPGPNVGGVPDLFNLTALAAKGGLLAPVDLGAPDEPDLPVTVQRAIDADFLRCQAHAVSLFAPLATDGKALNALWVQDVDSIQSSAPVQTGYANFGSCVRRNGVPAVASSSPAWYWHWLVQVIEPRVYPYGRTALINSLVAIDRHWTIVFVRCAGPVLSLAQRLQLQAQKAFFQAHYEQIQALDQLAAHTIEVVRNTA